MTYQDNCTLPNELLEQIAEQGLEAIPDMIRTLGPDKLAIHPARGFTQKVG